MRPQRLELTNHLVMGYGIHNKMSVHAPRRATEEELREFHDGDYIDFLRRYVSSSSSHRGCLPIQVSVELTRQGDA